jgi:hypothetical protein
MLGRDKRPSSWSVPDKKKFYEAGTWMAVELPMKVEAILRPRGGMSQTAVLTLLGIHSTK